MLFDVPAFTANENSKHITVDFPIELPNTEYTWILQNQSFVYYSSEAWQTGKVQEKRTDSAVVYIYNEQDHVINATQWGLFIFP